MTYYDFPIFCSPDGMLETGVVGVDYGSESGAGVVERVFDFRFAA